MLIAGWKKDAKELAYLGIEKCPNCKNYHHFSLYELSTKPTLYFIPIAKIKKKTVFACDLCNGSWEVDEAKRAELLRESACIPDQNVVGDLWNQIDERFAEEIQKANLSENTTAEEFAAVIEEFRDRMIQELSVPGAEYVIQRYLMFLADPDKPE